MWSTLFWTNFDNFLSEENHIKYLSSRKPFALFYRITFLVFFKQNFWRYFAKEDLCKCFFLRISFGSHNFIKDLLGIFSLWGLLKVIFSIESLTLFTKILKVFFCLWNSLSAVFFQWSHFWNLLKPCGDFSHSTLKFHNSKFK